MKIEWNWLKKRAEMNPTKIAVIAGETGEKWNYLQLYHLSLSTAALLHHYGIKRGDRVALLAPNGFAHLALLFACRELQAIFVPMNWRFSTMELQGLIDDAKPNLLFIDESFNRLINDLEGVEMHIVNVSKWQRAGSDRSMEDIILDLRIKAEDKKITSGWSSASIEEPSLDTPWLMIYTGGTTGKPKGAVLTYRSVLTNSLNTVMTWGLSEGDVTITVLPMFHTGGINALTLPVLHAGGTVALYSQFEPDKIAKGLDHYQCTIILMVPTMYRAFIETEEFKSSLFPSINVFLSGGAPCPIGIYDAFVTKGLAFKEGYGLTEAGPNNFVISPEVARQKPGSVGKPMLLNDILIKDDDGNEVPAGEVGELVIYGDHIFDHYWKREEETKKSIIEGGLHTGDLAYRDQDGDYYIIGRKKDMLITGGENVYPLEVENVLASFPQLLETSVVAIPDERWGERVVAAVVLDLDEMDESVGNPLTDTQAELDLEKTLITFCRQKLAGYKVPKEIYFFDTLPKTHVGKIAKTAITDKIKQRNRVYKVD